MAVENNYVIGVVFHKRLCPFLALKAGHQNVYMRIKLLVNGDSAKEIVPILREDPVNDLYFKEFELENTRLAEVDD